MSSTSDEIRGLREDMALMSEAMGLPNPTDVPKTREQVRDLAASDPDTFNQLFEKGLIKGELLGGSDDE